MSTRVLIYPLFLILLMAGTVTGADYALVGSGRGIAVCNAYLQNINSFPGYPPMVCRRPLNPKFPEFTKPNWEPLDVMNNLGLLEAIGRVRYRSLTPEQFEKWRASIKSQVVESHLSLAIADVDVDGDGAPEPVVRYDEGDCDPGNESTFSGPSGVTFYVLTPDRAQVDAKKTRWLHAAGRADLFLYNGQVFVSMWAGDLGFKRGLLQMRTTLAISGEGTIVCDYRYQGKWPRR